MNNVLVAFKTMHTINSTRKGSNYFQALKLNGSKAYDLVK